MAHPLAHDDPEQLGPYRLIARLGGGGMGTVYLGRSPAGRTVALKTMHGPIAQQKEFRTRFRLEIDAARVIGGEHGAQVVDADPFAPVPWLATEYVLGPPLDEAVALNGPLAERTVRALGVALCTGLRQLHSSDVVHRDLKPSNILVTCRGPKVIDFGIARAIGDERLTRVGSTAGTPAFMSPEQATGQEHSAAGDVFALAGVLVHALTGHGPFGGGQAADLLYRVRYAQPDLTGVPATLLPVLTRCLDKDPARRPGTAELAGQLRARPPGREREFAQELPDTLLAEIARRATEVWQIQPQRQPPPPGPDTDVPRPGLSRRKLLALTGGSALGLAAAGAGAWAWATRTEPEGGDVHGPAATARPANVPSRAVWWAEVTKVDERFAPIPAGDVVLVLSDDALVALDAKTGKRRWTRKWTVLYDGRKVTWRVVSDGERAYAFIPESSAPYRGVSVHSIDLNTGTAHRVAGPFKDLEGTMAVQAHPLLVARGVMYLVARKPTKGDSSIEVEGGWHTMAVELRTGEELWRRPFSGSYFPSALDGLTVATVAQNRLLLARRTTDLYAKDALRARDLGTGESAWSWTWPRDRLDYQSYLRPGQLVADDKRLYFANSALHAIQLSGGGDMAWEFGKGRNKGEVKDGSRPYGRPAVKDGVVFVAEGTRGLVAVDAARGKALWETGFGNASPSLDFTPVIGRKYAYVAVDGQAKISAVELRTHKVAWTVPVPGGFGNAGFVAHHRARNLVWTNGDFVCAMPVE